MATQAVTYIRYIVTVMHPPRLWPTLTRCLLKTLFNGHTPPIFLANINAHRRINTLVPLWSDRVQGLYLRVHSIHRKKNSEIKKYFLYRYKF